MDSPDLLAARLKGDWNIVPVSFFFGCLRGVFVISTDGITFATEVSETTFAAVCLGVFFTGAAVLALACIVRLPVFFGDLVAFTSSGVSMSAGFVGILGRDIATSINGLQGKISDALAEVRDQ
ncbi:MAG: hypothetical protein NC112_03120 [Oxalobacter formigenes]|nr:hypothetical protein [Oxalobacter formigenes]